MKKLKMKCKNCGIERTIFGIDTDDVIKGMKHSGWVSFYGDIDMHAKIYRREIGDRHWKEVDLWDISPVAHEYSEITNSHLFADMIDTPLKFGDFEYIALEIRVK